MNRFSIWMKAAFTLLVVMIMASVAIAQAGTESAGKKIGEAAEKHGVQGDSVIATVNGEPITLRDLEINKAAHQSGSDAAMTDYIAYQAALKNLVDHRLMDQEARRRGLTVDESAVQQQIESTRAEAARIPEIQRYLDEQQQALGLDDQAYWELLSQVIRQGLLATKLETEVVNALPTPTDAEVSAFFDQQPDHNALVLIPIEFPTADEAHRAMSELRQLQQQQRKDQFMTTFDSYARRSMSKSSSEVLHETFRFKNKQQLPDYVQAAAEQAEQTLTLFVRPNGKAVLSLILKSELVAEADARTQAKQSLIQDRQRAELDKLSKRLYQQARIQVFQDRVPAGARPLQLPTTR